MSGKLLGCFTACLLFGVYNNDYCSKVHDYASYTCLFTTWTQTIRWESFLVYHWKNAMLPC